MTKRRVVVTGIGTINPIGHNVEETWKSIEEGKCGIAPISLFDTKDMKVTLAGEVKDFDVTKYIDKKEAKKMDRFTQFALIAAQQLKGDALRVEHGEVVIQVDAVGHVIHGDAAVERAFRVYDHDGAERAETEAAGHDDLDFLVKALCLQFIRQSVVQSRAAGRGTAGTAADKYMRTDHNIYFLLKLLPNQRLVTPMVYSAIGLPPLMCFSMTSTALSGVILM